MNKKIIQALEKYSSGWRGAPAKGVDGLRRARVQIPLSPLMTKVIKKEVKKTSKKFLTNQTRCDNLEWLSQETEMSGNSSEKKFQKNKKSSWQAENDMIKYQSCQNDRNLDNWTVKHMNRKFFYILFLGSTNQNSKRDR